MRKRDVDKVIECVLQESEQGCVFLLLCGSINEGLARDSSDIDLVCVKEQLAEGEAEGYRSKIIEGNKVEILTIILTTFIDYVKEMQKGYSPKFQVPPDKLLFSRPIYGETNFSLYIGDFSKKEYLLQSQNFFQCRAVKLYYDSVIETGLDTANSILWLRYLVENIVNSYLIVNGDAYVRLKWVLSRIERSTLHPWIKNKINEILCWGPGLSADSVEWVYQVLYVVRLIQLMHVLPKLDIQKVLDGSSPIAPDSSMAFAMNETDFLVFTNGRRLKVDRYAVILYLLSTFGMSVGMIKKILKENDVDYSTSSIHSVLRYFQVS